MVHMYYHGGSYNHGCEAIVRSTHKILNCPDILWSFSPQEDISTGLSDLLDIRDDRYTGINRHSFRFLRAAVEHKLTGEDYSFIKFSHSDLYHSVRKGDICLSIGGDNYCYSGVDILGYYNRMLKERGAKTVLWGCSVEPEALDQGVIADLNRYDLITVRESLSYEALLAHGITTNVVLCADPAFLLEKENISPPSGFGSDSTIGINMSPLVMEYGKNVLDNYIELVRYILEETNNNVMLIPHVIKPDSDDRTALRKIYSRYEDNPRIVLIDDCNCMQLKGYISHCRIFIGARTHATIAAYSMGIPTLVAGYSIKSKGIAADIFGTYENYVISAGDMKTAEELKKAYRWIEEHFDTTRELLYSVMPEYKQKALDARRYLDQLGL